MSECFWTGKTILKAQIMQWFHAIVALETKCACVKLPCNYQSFENEPMDTSVETIIQLFDYSVGMTLFNSLTHYLNSR